MDKTKTIEQLKTLAVAADGRSESSRLGDIIGDVEAALKAGVKRGIVLETLRQHYGFTMSMSGFEKALKRYRKNRHGKVIDTPTASNFSVMVTKPTVTDTESSKKFISPEDIRKKRIETMEEAKNLESENYDFNYEEMKK
jgi:hypothetical protein